MALARAQLSVVAGPTAAGGVVVANPGGISWMIQSAGTLAEHGELAAYCSPAVVSEHELGTLERRLPGPIARRVVGQLRLRAAPTTIPADRIVRAATPTEVVYVLANRMQLPWRVISRLDHWQARAFDAGVSRLMNSRVDAVIGYQGTAARTFELAGRHGVARVLDYPIAHFAVTEQVLREEVKRVPRYATTMVGHQIERWRKDRYAREIELAERIIMLSSYHQRTFEDAGVGAERTIKAPLGVDSELFSPGTPRDDGLFRVLFCGLITQRKGISYLVDAFRRAELEHAELVFAGRPVGNPNPWLDEPRVRHVPALARPRLVNVYRSADVLVLPSLIEGFGATPLEAMACGVPAIVSEHTFGHDVIEDGIDGWVTPIRDPDAIAERLRNLYEDRNLHRRMGQAARRKAEQFTWPRYGEALRTGIAALLGSGNGTAG